MVFEDGKNEKGDWITYVKIGDRRLVTRAWQTWQGICARCAENGAQQQLKKSYVGCVNSFPDYQSFASWAQNQIGYRSKFQLDKDILVQNNKIYSDETCVFVPPSINGFFRVFGGVRELPVGVQRSEIGNRFVATLTKDGVKFRVGTYDTEEEAHAAYVSAKIDVAHSLANRWEELVDARVIDALRKLDKNANIFKRQHC